MALVNDLDREITELEKLLGLANVLGINDTLRVSLATWREYCEQQNTLAMALMDQYLIQVRINDL